MINTVQGCNQSTDIIQRFVVNGNANYIQGVLLDQSVQNNLGCVAQADTQTQIVNALTAELQQQAASAPGGGGFFFGLAYNWAVTTNSTVQKTVVNNMVNAVQTCDTNQNITQEWILTGKLLLL